MVDKFLTVGNVKVNGEIADFDYTTFRTSLGSTIKMGEAFRVEYLLMKDAQSSHSKSFTEGKNKQGNR
jgi:hypothetical protein